MGRAPLVIRNFDDFLRAAIHRYWESPARDRQTFLALLFATRESLPVALERMTKPETQKRALLTSAAAVGVTVLLRTLLGGPVGLLLTAGSLAGLGKLYVQSAPEIKERSIRIRRVIGSYRTEVEASLAGGRGGALSDDQLELMLEGLLGRFLGELDETDRPKASAPSVRDAESSFAAHVAKQRGPR